MYSSIIHFPGTFATKDQGDSEYEQDLSGLVTASVWADYLKAGGIIPGLIYVSVALVCQAIRVYTDLWLSKWTEDGSHDVETSNPHEKVNSLSKIHRSE